jgi:hypothetical protein
MRKKTHFLLEPIVTSATFVLILWEVAKGFVGFITYQVLKKSWDWWIGRKKSD